MSAFAALAATLGELADAVRGLTHGDYTARDLSSSGSIGAHVRHCLDHVAALERALVGGEACYDHRQRDTVVERDPRLGESRLRRASVRIGRYDARLLDQPLALAARLTRAGLPLRVQTTVGREVAFVLSHTIHHAAMVAVLLEHAAHDVPAGLGLAPTTPAMADRGVRTADRGVRRADRGVRHADRGVRIADCGLRSADRGLRSAPCAP